jgi:hypothetical protein
VDLYELLNGTDSAQIDAIVEELLGDDADEAELPILAMRRGATVVRAASAEPAGEQRQRQQRQQRAAQS